VIKLAGVVAIEDSFEEANPGLRPGVRRRFSAASSAASFREMAEPFLLVVLN
jgi:hypothetical protein